MKKLYEIQGRRAGRQLAIYEVRVGPRGSRYTGKLIKKVWAYDKDKLERLLRDLNLGIG